MRLYGGLTGSNFAIDQHRADGFIDGSIGQERAIRRPHLTCAPLSTHSQNMKVTTRGYPAAVAKLLRDIGQQSGPRLGSAVSGRRNLGCSRRDPR